MAKRVPSLRPKTVLLTHDRRDHTRALPVQPGKSVLLLVPKLMKGLVWNFLVAEAQVNYGESTAEEQTLEACWFDLVGTEEGMRIMLDRPPRSGSSA